MVTVKRGMPGRVRIVGGRWRGRKIPVADLPGLRPTPDRARETLFNWLQGRIDGARCLDLFAGTGVLGLEALSRGAASVVSVEQEQRLVTALQHNAGTLGCSDIEIVHANGLEWIQRCGKSFDLVFLDPPFAEGLATQACAALIKCQVLKPGALVYVETEQGAMIETGKFEILKQSSAGRVQYMLLALKSE